MDNTFTFKTFYKTFHPEIARYKRDRIWDIKVTDQNNNVLMCDSFGDFRHSRVPNILERRVIAWWVEAHHFRVVVENTGDPIF